MPTQLTAEVETVPMTTVSSIGRKWYNSRDKKDSPETNKSYTNNSVVKSEGHAGTEVNIGYQQQ